MKDIIKKSFIYKHRGLLKLFAALAAAQAASTILKRFISVSNSIIDLIFDLSASLIVLVPEAVKHNNEVENLRTGIQHDFIQTARNLENHIFKIIRNSKGEYCTTLSEGKIAEELGITTREIYGSTTFDIFPPETAAYITSYQEKAFSGERVEFELQFHDKTYFVTYSPIVEHDEVTEVVGCGIDITKYKIAQEKIEYMAKYDSLTALPNRFLLKSKFEFIVSHVHRSNSQAGLIILDLDRFKIINDTLGHEAGDKLLSYTAQRLKSLLREDDTLFRFGGDEFVILLSEIESEDSAASIAQMIIDNFRNPFMIEERELFVTVSMGIAMFPLDGNTVEVLIQNADTAMNRAKESGRNKYQFFTNSMNEKAAEKLAMGNYLRKALEKGELSVLYQPLMDSYSGKIVGTEALLRWKHPVLGMISPAVFIPIAEESGLIVEIGKWVLRTAVRQVKLWNDMGYPIRMSVNVSAIQFKEENIIEDFSRIITEEKVSPQNIELEITENTIMENTERTLQTMEKLKKFGLSIAIDDFGTGFSSLSYLNKFKVDVLKIDRSFIKNINESLDDMNITSAIVGLSHSLNLKVVAEGVETREQKELLVERNCDFMQGYYFSKPVSAEELEKILIETKLYKLAVFARQVRLLTFNFNGYELFFLIIVFR